MKDKKIKKRFLIGLIVYPLILLLFGVTYKLIVASESTHYSQDSGDVITRDVRTESTHDGKSVTRVVRKKRNVGGILYHPIDLPRDYGSDIDVSPYLGH